MSTPEHTEKSWYVMRSAGDHQKIVANETDGKTVAVVYDPHNGDGELIAAAPKLLEALKQCLYRLDEHDQQSAPECRLARAAIAKAEGN